MLHYIWIHFVWRFSILLFIYIFRSIILNAFEYVLNSDVFNVCTLCQPPSLSLQCCWLLFLYFHLPRISKELLPHKILLIWKFQCSHAIKCIHNINTHNPQYLSDWWNFIVQQNESISIEFSWCRIFDWELYSVLYTLHIICFIFGKCIDYWLLSALFASPPFTLFDEISDMKWL